MAKSPISTGGALADVLGRLATEGTRATAASSLLADSLKKVANVPGAKPPGAGKTDPDRSLDKSSSAASASVASFGQALGRIPVISAFAPVVQAAAKLAQASAQSAPAAQGAASALGKVAASGQQAGGSVVSLGAAFGLVAGVAAAVPAALQSLAQEAVQTAGLLSPASLKQFMRAIDDTKAAIGVALLPVLQTMTGLIRDAGQLILPIARDLAPVFQRLADVAAGQLTSEMEALAGVVTALLPLVDALVSVNELMVAVTRPVIDAVALLADLLAPGIKQLSQEIEILLVPLKLLADVAADTQKAIKVVAEGLASALNFNLDLSAPLSDLRDAAAETRAGFQNLLKSLILFSAAIAKAISPAFGDKVIQGMLKSIGGPKREGTEGLRPADNARIITAEQFGKDLLVAASMAGAGGQGRKTQEDFVKSIEGQLRDLLKDNTGMAQQIINAMLNDLPGKLAEAINNKAADVRRRAEDVAFGNNQQEPNFAQRQLRRANDVRNDIIDRRRRMFGI